MGSGRSRAQAAPALALAVGLTLVAAAGAGAAHASPDLSLDDPAYLDLARARAAGALPPYLGGVRPLTEARIAALRLAAGLPPDPRLVSAGLRGFWLAPVSRLRVRGLLVRDHLRPYSTEVHPRDLAGGVSISCEHQEGRTCGAGAGLESELDSAAGHGAWLAAATRVRVLAGTSQYDADAAIDRAYASAELGPLTVLVGRDALVIGPSPRTHAAWGDHIAPLDQVRASTAPIDLIGPRGSTLRGSALFFLGRLRDPQTFHGALVDGTRVQADLWDTVELGLTHLIVMGGDGAPDFSLADYVFEHVRHKAGEPFSLGFASNRLAADAAVTVPSAAGLRVSYQVATEDLRDEFGSMLRHDADHVLSVEVDRVGPRAGLLVELTRTGVRSHEHQLFTTGTTSLGRIAGAPLGPSSTAAFVGARVDLDGARLWPWLELADQSSDLYAFGTGPIVRTKDLPDERRARGGLRAAVDLAPDLRVELSGLAERVTTADFIPGHTRWNAAAEVAATWTPLWRVAR